MTYAMNRKAVRKLDICYSAVRSFRRSLFLPCYGPPSSTPPPLQTLPLPFSFSLNVSSAADAASSASISASALSDPMPRRRPQIPERRNRIPPPPALPRNDWEHQPRREGRSLGPHRTQHDRNLLYCGWPRAPSLVRRGRMIVKSKSGNWSAMEVGRCSACR